MCRATHLRKLKRHFMLAEAVLQLSEWKIEVASQMMDARQIQKLLGVFGHWLRFSERRECILDPIDNAIACRQSDQGLTSLAIGRGESQGGLELRDRTLWFASIVQEFTQLDGGGEAFRVITSENEGMFGEGQRLLEMITVSLRLRSFDICSNRPRITSPIKVLGLQSQIMIGKPSSSTDVKIPSRRFEQRGIDALLNEGVSKQKILTIGP